jgi:hypothetical protein
MKHNYFLGVGKAAGLLLALWLLAPPAQAQAPAWVLATAATSHLAGSGSVIHDMAADASGNLLVTGSFNGQVTFGSTTLTSAGGGDLFIAKYLTATNTWAWAQRGGGQGDDAGLAIAVSGTSVYVAGNITNDRANTAGVTLTSTSPGTGSSSVPVAGSSMGITPDILVAKYTDTGSGATLGWVQVAGGTAFDYAQDLAVSGSSVYITGYITNNLPNQRSVVFGGNGTVVGTAVQAGASATSSQDLVVAKYTDNGGSATFQWSQVGGGTYDDFGSGVAVSGANVYVTGSYSNDKANSGQVLFGGAGTIPGTASQVGMATSISSDLVVAKYVDNGSSATLGWTQTGGGSVGDGGYSIAVSGNKVYVAGVLTNDSANSRAVVFGGSGATAGTVQVNGATATSSYDMLLAKYTDNGPTATLNWTQVGGGTDYDAGTKVLANGPNVYVAGLLSNDAANANGAIFGGSGTVVGTASQAGATATSSYDILVAKYTDNGAAATLDWTQVGGSPQRDLIGPLALANSRLYVGGAVVPAATFGSLSIGAQAGSFVGFLGAVSATVLAAAPPLAATSYALFPNPAPGPATLSGAAPGTAVQVFDALGRRVATATTDASGTAVLPGGLAPGLYLVRAGAGTVRWAVE